MRGQKMLELKKSDLQYIYQNKELVGVILNINTFESLMELLEDFEDSIDFERLKDEDTMDYEEYRKNRLSKTKNVQRR
ncbi:MAG: hypothetical protein ACE5KE_07225 [Methanosarcinales archaeon]